MGNVLAIEVYLHQRAWMKAPTGVKRLIPWRGGGVGGRVGTWVWSLITFYEQPIKPF